MSGPVETVCGLTIEQASAFAAREVRRVFEGGLFSVNGLTEASNRDPILGLAMRILAEFKRDPDLASAVHGQNWREDQGTSDDRDSWRLSPKALSE